MTYTVKHVTSQQPFVKNVEAVFSFFTDIKKKEKKRKKKKKKEKKTKVKKNDHAIETKLWRLFPSYIHHPFQHFTFSIHQSHFHAYATEWLSFPD